MLVQAPAITVVNQLQYQLPTFENAQRIIRSAVIDPSKVRANCRYSLRFGLVLVQAPAIITWWWCYFGVEVPLLSCHGDEPSSRHHGFPT